ncbi:hypothetical protein GOZ78_01985 [Agrobacterium vitis]|uniref:Uncharacterized protein n=1 Tax=Agrobacterium vitis TaxID=373 RepID=A0ABD6G9R6_AGRVI|nr:hypothetical protein [Agrobacterium vitis]MCE6073434.1 hypothetical protein [Agrobacterium vitis]MUO69161.1 hypothetical protein [Agrobacterium vitis]MUO77670.1 hypothetical protein [Agrobacterium vitis]MUO93187.1 hypothetical protein [Agrobacterium vitis]MUP04538.1 hypothetical protein [Agrobacterium vitis]
MGRRTIPFTEDSIARAIKAVKRAGVEIKTVRVNPDGAVVINGDNDQISEKQLEESARGYL